MLCNLVTDWKEYQGGLCVVNTKTGTKPFPSSVDSAREGNGNEKKSSRTKLQGYVQKMSTTLAFDPLVSPSYFQLISIWSHKDYLDSNYRIEVYTSKTDTWRLCYASKPLHHLDIAPSNSILMKPGVYWNKSVNWLNTDGSMVFYKIDRKKFKVSRSTIGYRSELQNGYFDQSRGDLILVKISIASGMLQVYHMSFDHSGWQSKHAIDLHQISPALGFRGSIFKVLLADIGEDLKSAYVVNQGSGVYLVHHGKTFIKDLGVQLQHDGTFDTFKYIDTIPEYL